MIRSDKMRTTYEIDCLKFSKLSISSPPNSRKEYRSSVASNNSGTNNAGQNSVSDYHHHHHRSSHHHHHQNHVNGYKPLLPRIDFPTSQFDRLLHMDQKEFTKNSWRSNGCSFDSNEKKKK